MKFKLEIPEGECSKIIQEEIQKPNSDFPKLSRLCLSKATKLFKNDEPYFQYLYASKLFNLLSYKDIPSQKVKVIGIGACDYCRSQRGKVYSITEAIEGMPLPHEKCTNGLHGKREKGFCLCAYSPIIEDHKQTEARYHLELPDDKVFRKIKRELKKKAPDYFSLQGLCFTHAFELFEKYDDDYFLYAQASRFFELLGYKTKGFLKKVEILANGSCEECIKHNGEVYTIDEALEKMPIPNSDCVNWKEDFDGNHKHGYCRCTWLPVIEDD